MKEKSFLVTVAMAAIAKKIAAVIPPAEPDELPAVATSPRRTVSDRCQAYTPAMNVKPNSATTPHALLRRRVTTNSEPIITAEHQERRHDRRRTERARRSRTACRRTRRAMVGKQRQGEQPVRVAQDGVLRDRYRQHRLVAAARGIPAGSGGNCD